MSDLEHRVGRIESTLDNSFANMVAQVAGMDQKLDNIIFIYNTSTEEAKKRLNKLEEQVIPLKGWVKALTIILSLATITASIAGVCLVLI